MSGCSAPSVTNTYVSPNSEPGKLITSMDAAEKRARAAGPKFFRSIPSDFSFAFKMQSDRPDYYFDSQIQADLAEAAARGDTATMQALISSGADVNYTGKNGMKPLFWAMAKTNIQGFKFLLDNGADPNATVILTAGRAPKDNALTLAAARSNSNFLEELLKHGANPNAIVDAKTPEPADPNHPMIIGTDINGNPVWNTNRPVVIGTDTAIFTAAEDGKPENVTILLKHGADIDWKDINGDTPMKCVVGLTNFRMALFLFRAGANPEVKNKAGWSVIDTLKKYKDQQASSENKAAYQELVAELIQRGLLDSAP